VEPFLQSRTRRRGVRKENNYEIRAGYVLSRRLMCRPGQQVWSANCDCLSQLLNLNSIFLTRTSVEALKSSYHKVYEIKAQRRDRVYQTAPFPKTDGDELGPLEKLIIRCVKVVCPRICSKYPVLVRDTRPSLAPFWYENTSK
jgi:hypothetical protein